MILRWIQDNTDSTQIEKGWYLIAHDIETKIRFPKKGVKGLLLSAFYMGGDSVVIIDNTSVDNSEVFTQDTLSRSIFIAHNADFEARWGLSTNFMPARYVCTMVNEKRLLAGQQGFHFDLVSSINRRLGSQAIPEWMIKDIRSQFSKIEYFCDEHILYNASDTLRLHELYRRQLELAEQYGQSFMLKSLNSRVIIPLAEAEYLGVKHDTEKWLKIAEERKDKADKICQELDDLVTNQYQISPEAVNPVYQKEKTRKQARLERNLQRKEKLEKQIQNLEEKEKTHLKSYLVSKEQLNKLLLDLQELDSVVEPATGLINWSSPKQVLKIMSLISCPLPMAKDKEEHKLKPGVGKEARANWFVQNESSPFLTFMNKFDSYKKTIHNVNSFGKSWVDQYVRDGRAFTSFDQAGTDTGRLSSGEKGRGEKEFANMQQVPGKGEDKVYRECFIADDGRALITADYSNCEGIIMISLSRDLNMKRITEMADSHSYLGTLCWRAVYKHRYQKTGDPKWLDLSQTYEMNQTTLEKKEERTKFKNSGGLFPVAYGVSANKVAASAQITEAEGQAMIDTIKAEIPEVIKVLDKKSKEATNLGYVTHNTRTNSRRWFTPILDSIKYGFPVTKSQLIEAEMAARNSPIQGTNSEIIKEAIALIHLWARLFKQDLRLLLTVHDELVYDCPKEKAEFFAAKVKELMKRAAKNYLIPEIDMDVDCRVGSYWKK